MRSVVHISTEPFRYDQGPTSGPKQCESAYTPKALLVKWIHDA